MRGLRASASAVDDEGLGTLALMGMGRTCVHLQLRELLTAEAVLGEHAPNGAAHGIGRLAVEFLGVGG